MLRLFFGFAKKEAQSLKSKIIFFLAQSAFSYPSDHDWDRPVIVASPKVKRWAKQQKAKHAIT